MAAADVHTRMVGGDERDGDADVLARADQAVRIVQAVGQAEQRGHRSQRDVALLPGHAHAEHALALVLAPAHDPVVGNRARVRPGLGAGQREARHLHALRQTRQVVALLLLGAVVQEQLRRPQRVRHHHRHARSRAAAGELHHHFGMRQRGEAHAAVLPGDDHPEEAAVLDELPDLGRQVAQLMGDLPLVDHAAQLLHRAVEKRALFRTQRRPRHGQQLAPVRPAAEQIAVPPHGPCVQGLLLGLGHLREDALEPDQQRIADQHAAQLRDQQHARGRDEERPQQSAPQGREPGQRCADQEGRTCRSPHPPRRAEARPAPRSAR